MCRINKENFCVTALNVPSVSFENVFLFCVATTMWASDLMHAFNSS